MTHASASDTTGPTMAELLADVADLTVGAVVTLMPVLIVAVPCIVLIVVPLVALGAVLAVAGGVLALVAAPPYLLFRALRGRRA